MPIAPVNDAGAVIYYEDSGAPPNSSDYLTIVIVHGLVFHGHGFVGTFPYAASHNLRILALNLRDYPGSTPYTESELDLLCREDLVSQEVAIRNQGREVAAFLKHFVLKENPPAVRNIAGKKTGGVALVTWSLGNVLGMSMFAHAAGLDEETKSILQRSLRSWVLYDPPQYPFGIPLMEEVYYPLRDETIPMEERGVVFGRWVSAFWTPAPEPTNEPLTLGARRIVTDDPHLLPTIECLSPEEAAAASTPGVLKYSGKSIFTTNDKVWWENAHRALCDIDDVLSHVNALHIWCEMSPSPCMLAAKNIIDRLREASESGKATRDVTLFRVERANHFMHWHEPERFLQILTDNL